VSLLGGAGQSEASIVADDKRALTSWYLGMYVALSSYYTRSCGLQPGSYRSMCWPGSGIGQGIGDAGDVSPLAGVWYLEPDVNVGASSMFGITGVTRDAYGAPLPFVTVKLYKTATDLVLYTTTSDGNGNFLVLTSYYPDQHYLVFYKAGSPDIFATTPNTLVAG
jgi:hypothetical protein